MCLPAVCRWFTIIEKKYIFIIHKWNKFLVTGAFEPVHPRLGGAENQNRNG